ncbi:MAP3K12-binding inhibitory protein 1 [Caerostris extrusa]|uniref:MAP3K12-binding inhibitory protein 1 n=1 Tax=Caerostris extrusa TaxID=172846 RepID=A0AAV4VCT5_CAEEX|nr:MAP3K12-binding inhibitory protein 1 [Caerostris extrusa]
MSEPKSTIAIVEYFLKELQRIQFIKNYNLQPTEFYQDNLDEFESIILKFTKEVDNTLYSYKNVGEDCLVENIDVPEPDSGQNHLETTEENKNISDSMNMVQLQVTEEEIKRRIQAFISRKRKEVDEKNVQEFCSRPFIDEDDPMFDEVDSCARVDAVFIPRFGSKSRVKVSRVENKRGPQFQDEAVKHIKTEPDSSTETEHQSNSSLETVKERLSSMETHLKIETDNKIKNNIYQRLKKLEDKILYLEGISPEYFNLSPPNMSSKKQNITEKEKMYSNWTVDDIQKRIQALTESLKSKNNIKKEPPV